MNFVGLKIELAAPAAAGVAVGVIGVTVFLWFGRFEEAGMLCLATLTLAQTTGNE